MQGSRFTNSKGSFGAAVYATRFNTIVSFRGVALQQNGVAEEGRGKGLSPAVRLGR